MCTPQRSSHNPFSGNTASKQINTVACEPARLAKHLPLCLVTCIKIITIKQCRYPSDVRVCDCYFQAHAEFFKYTNKPREHEFKAERRCYIYIYIYICQRHPVELAMIQSILLGPEETLRSTQHQLTAHDRNVLKNLTEILTPFQSATHCIQGIDITL